MLFASQNVMFSLLRSSRTMSSFVGEDLGDLGGLLCVWKGKEMPNGELQHVEWCYVAHVDWQRIMEHTLSVFSFPRRTFSSQDWPNLTNQQVGVRITALLPWGQGPRPAQMVETEQAAQLGYMFILLYLINPCNHIWTNMTMIYSKNIWIIISFVQYLCTLKYTFMNLWFLLICKLRLKNFVHLVLDLVESTDKANGFVWISSVAVALGLPYIALHWRFLICWTVWASHL